MSHQETVTFEIGGKHYNVPTKVQGKKLSPRGALAKAREFHSLGKGYRSEDEAIRAAKQKSADAPRNVKSLGKVSH